MLFGPAARALPQLPIMVDEEGYVVAHERVPRTCRTELLGTGASVMSDAATTATPTPMHHHRRAPAPLAGSTRRVGLGGLLKKQLRKVFPDHWSFMLGEIALWSFVILLLTGVFLSLWFKPSMAEVEYMGSYAQPARDAHVGGLLLDAGTCRSTCAAGC